MLTRRRPARARVQRPLRRPRDPGADAAARGRPARGPRRGGARRPRRGALHEGRGGGDGRAGRAGLPGPQRLRRAPRSTGSTRRRRRARSSSTAAPRCSDGALVTSGGRILSVTGLGADRARRARAGLRGGRASALCRRAVAPRHRGRDRLSAMARSARYARSRDADAQVGGKVAMNGPAVGSARPASLALVAPAVALGLERHAGRTATLPTVKCPVESRASTARSIRATRRISSLAVPAALARASSPSYVGGTAACDRAARLALQGAGGGRRQRRDHRRAARRRLALVQVSSWSIPACVGCMFDAGAARTSRVRRRR